MFNRELKYLWELKFKKCLLKLNSKKWVAVCRQFKKQQIINIEKIFESFI